MPVFRAGSPWHMGHVQMGYGLSGLFRSMARAVTPMVKSVAKPLKNIAMESGKKKVDALAGKNIKQVAKKRALEAAHVSKNRAMQRVRTYVQTGSGKKGPTSSTRQRKKTDKKRKAPASKIRSNPAKKRKTSPEDVLMNTESEK